jgi:hypothetical protein
MKVLNLSTADNANFAHDNAKALRSVGVYCEDVKTSKHPFNYPTESKIMNPQQIYNKAKDFDIIQIFHSEVRLLNLVRNLNKVIVVYQTGSIYRVNPTYYNNAFNPYVAKSITALGELMNLGAINETYLVGAVEVPPLQTNIQTHKFAHYPSSAKVKGTTEIIDMMQGYDFHYDTNIVPFPIQHKRMRECSVYIELFKPELNGNPYGSFGITALEAAGMGKIVVTQNLSNAVYIKYYGDNPLVLCDTVDAFKKNVAMLDSLGKPDINQLQLRTYDWVNDNHSYKATGLKLKNILDEL